MNESGVEKLVGALTLFVCENFGRGERPPSSASVPFFFFFLTPLSLPLCQRLEYKKSKANIGAVFPMRPCWCR